MRNLQLSITREQRLRGRKTPQPARVMSPFDAVLFVLLSFWFVVIFSSAIVVVNAQTSMSFLETVANSTSFPHIITIFDASTPGRGGSGGTSIHFSFSDSSATLALSLNTDPTATSCTANLPRFIAQSIRHNTEHTFNYGDVSSRNLAVNEVYLLCTPDGLDSKLRLYIAPEIGTKHVPSTSSFTALHGVSTALFYSRDMLFPLLLTATDLGKGASSSNNNEQLPVVVDSDPFKIEATQSNTYSTAAMVAKNPQLNQQANNNVGGLYLVQVGHSCSRMNSQGDVMSKTSFSLTESFAICGRSLLEAMSKVGKSDVVALKVCWEGSDVLQFVIHVATNTRVGRSGNSSTPAAELEAMFSSGTEVRTSPLSTATTTTLTQNHHHQLLIEQNDADVKIPLRTANRAEQLGATTLDVGFYFTSSETLVGSSSATTLMASAWGSLTLCSGSGDVDAPFLADVVLVENGVTSSSSSLQFFGTWRIQTAPSSASLSSRSTTDALPSAQLCWITSNGTVTVPLSLNITVFTLKTFDMLAKPVLPSTPSSSPLLPAEVLVVHPPASYGTLGNNLQWSVALEGVNGGTSQTSKNGNDALYNTFQLEKNGDDEEVEHLLLLVPEAANSTTPSSSLSCSPDAGQHSAMMVLFNSTWSQAEASTVLDGTLTVPPSWYDTPEKRTTGSGRHFCMVKVAVNVSAVRGSASGNEFYEASSNSAADVASSSSFNWTALVVLATSKGARDDVTSVRFLSDPLRLKSFRLEIIRLDGVVVDDGFSSSRTALGSQVVLFSDNNVTAELLGDLGTATISVGYWQLNMRGPPIHGCRALASSSPSNRTFELLPSRDIQVDALGSSGDSGGASEATRFCALRPPPHDLIPLARMEQIEIAAKPQFGDTDQPFLFASDSEVQIVAMTASNTDILPRLTFSVCDTSKSASTPPTLYPLMSPYTSLRVLAPRGSIGTHRICWQYYNSTATYLMSLTVLPAPSLAQPTDTAPLEQDDGGPKRNELVALASTTKQNLVLTFLEPFAPAFDSEVSSNIVIDVDLVKGASSCTASGAIVSRTIASLSGSTTLPDATTHAMASTTTLQLPNVDFSGVASSTEGAFLLCMKLRQQSTSTSSTSSSEPVNATGRLVGKLLVVGATLSKIRVAAGGNAIIPLPLAYTTVSRQVVLSPTASVLQAQVTAIGGFNVPVEFLLGASLSADKCGMSKTTFLSSLPVKWFSNETLAVKIGSSTAITSWRMLDVFSTQERASSTSSTKAICVAIDNGDGVWLQAGVSVAAVDVVNVDGQATPTLNSSDSTTVVAAAPVAALSSTQKALQVTGINLNVASQITFSFFTSLSATCSPSSSGTPQQAAVLVVNSVSSGSVLLPALSSTSFNVVCASISDVQTGSVFTVQVSLYYHVLPLVAIGNQRADFTQQTVLASPRFVNRTLPLRMDLPASSYTLPLTFKVFVSSTSSSSEAGACNAKSAAAANSELPVSFNAAKNQLLLDVDGRLYEDAYNLCAQFTRTSTSTRRQTSETLYAPLGLTLYFVELTIGTEVLKSPTSSSESTSVIGVTANSNLELYVTGTNFNQAHIYFGLQDAPDCSPSVMTGATSSGAARKYVLASGCSNNVGSATLPASTSIPDSDLYLCLAVEPAIDNIPIANLHGIVAPVRVAITNPTGLMVVQEPSSVANSLSDGTLATQPIIALTDASSGARLNSIPSGLSVKAEWISISPLEARLGESYTIVAKQGDSVLDFSTRPAASQIRLRNAKFGFQYVLEFSVIGESSLATVNTTTTVEIAGCTGSDMAVIFASDCDTCPTHASCNGTTDILVQGYMWRPHPNSLNFYSCDSPYADRTCTPNTTTGTCIAGHSGPRCTVCEHNYAMTFNTCVRCGNFAVNVFLVALAVAVSIFVIVVLVLSTLQCKKSDQFPIYVKLFINHLTVSSMLEYSRSLPRAAQQLFHIQRQVSRPSPTYAAFDCATGANWYQKFIMVNSLPICFAIVLTLLLMYLKRKRISEKRKSLAIEAHASAAREDLKRMGVQVSMPNFSEKGHNSNDVSIDGGSNKPKGILLSPICAGAAPPATSSNHSSSEGTTSQQMLLSDDDVPSGGGGGVANPLEIKRASQKSSRSSSTDSTPTSTSLHRSRSAKTVTFSVQQVSSNSKTAVATTINDRNDEGGREPQPQQPSAPPPLMPIPSYSGVDPNAVANDSDPNGGTLPMPDAHADTIGPGSPGPKDFMKSDTDNVIDETARRPTVAPTTTSSSEGEQQPSEPQSHSEEGPTTADLDELPKQHSVAFGEDVLESVPTMLSIDIRSSGDASTSIAGNSNRQRVGSNGSAGAAPGSPILVTTTAASSSTNNEMVVDRRRSNTSSTGSHQSQQQHQQVNDAHGNPFNAEMVHSVMPSGQFEADESAAIWPPLGESKYSGDDDPKLSRKASENLGILEVHSVVHQQSLHHVFTVSMIVMLFFAYPSIVEWCANILRCDEIDYSEPLPNGTTTNDVRSYFYYDRSQLCTDPRHEEYRVAGIILGIVWGFGTPLFAVVSFKRYRRPRIFGGMGRAAASRMFTFLVAGYRKELWWWEAPMMIRKLCLIYIFSFVRNDSLQTILAFWVLVIHLVAHQYLEPYEYQTVDDMERASLVSLCLTLQLSFMFEWISMDHAETQYQVYGYFVTAIILLINIIVLLWMLAIIVREGYNNFQKWIRDNRAWIDEVFGSLEAEKDIEAEGGVVDPENPPPKKWPRIHAWLLKHEYPMPQAVVAIDIKGEAVEIPTCDMTKEEQEALKEDSGSDWSEEDEEEIARQAEIERMRKEREAKRRKKKGRRATILSLFSSDGGGTKDGEEEEEDTDDNAPLPDFSDEENGSKAGGGGGAGGGSETSSIAGGGGGKRLKKSSSSFFIGNPFSAVFQSGLFRSVSHGNMLKKTRSGSNGSSQPGGDPRNDRPILALPPTGGKNAPKFHRRNPQPKKIAASQLKQQQPSPAVSANSAEGRTPTNLSLPSPTHGAGGRRASSTGPRRPTVFEAEKQLENEMTDAGDVVASLSAICDGLGEHNDNLLARNQEKDRRLESALKSVDLYQKQLSVANEYGERLKTDVDTYMLELDDARKALKLMEEENAKLRETLEAGGVKEYPLAMEDSIKRIIQERNQLAKIMAQREMEFGGSLLSKPEGFVAPKTPQDEDDLLESQDLGEGGGGLLQKGASFAIFKNIRGYKSRLRLIEATKAKKLEDLQETAQMEVSLRQQQVDIEHEAQQEIIQRHLEEKLRARKEAKRARKRGQTPVPPDTSVISTTGDPLASSTASMKKWTTVLTSFMVGNTSSDSDEESKRAAGGGAPSPGLADLDGGGRPNSEFFSPTTANFALDDVWQREMSSNPDDFPTTDEEQEQRILVVKKRHPKKRAPEFVAPWGHGTWEPPKPVDPVKANVSAGGGGVKQSSKTTSPAAVALPGKKVVGTIASPSAARKKKR